MANDKLIIYLIVLFVVYKLFINKESFRFAKGQVNYGKIDLYCADITTTPVQKYVVTPDISSIGTVNLGAGNFASAFNITSLATGVFNPNSLTITCYTRSNWTSDIKKITMAFGSNIIFAYNATLNRLELSGMTTANLGFSTISFPGSDGAPVLTTTLYLTWT